MYLLQCDVSVEVHGMYFLQCDAGVGVHGMYKQLSVPPAKLMVLGAACSPVSEATAQASHHWNISQVGRLSVLPSCSIIFYSYIYKS